MANRTTEILARTRHSFLLADLLADARLRVADRYAKQRLKDYRLHGVSGYQEFLEVIFDPNYEEYEHLLGWAGGPFQAEEFDVKAINETLSRMRWPIRSRSVSVIPKPHNRGGSAEEVGGG